MKHRPTAQAHRRANRPPHSTGRWLVLRAILTAATLSALVMVGWGVKPTQLLELSAFLLILTLALLIPAALTVALLKLAAQIHHRHRQKKKTNSPP
ncbi:MAG: hypothetical protein GDA55_00695 [Cellvibrionales bacterium]|nr:hypothetical protein [Cellvibrionales bacterium]